MDSGEHATDDVTARLDALEARVAALETTDSPTAAPPSASAGAPEGLWMIDGLQQTLPPGGGVGFAGTVTIGAGAALYQWVRPTSVLTEDPWDDQLERIAAVAHPTRGAIMRRLLDGPATVTEIVEAGLVSSAGTAYHHVAALTAAGWIAKAPGGRLSIPAGRVVPLMTLVTCGEDH